MSKTNKDKQKKLLCEIIAADEKDMWIKTSERLPGEGEMVLGYYGEDESFEIAYIDYIGDWRQDNGDRPYFAITHWRHLPYPPNDEPKTADNRLKGKPLNYIEVDFSHKQRDGGWISIFIDGEIQDMFSVNGYLKTFPWAGLSDWEDIVEVKAKEYGINEVIFNEKRIMNNTNELLQEIEKWAQIYDFNFQFWGKDWNTVYIEKDGILVGEKGGLETILDVFTWTIEKVYEWNRVPDNERVITRS